ncbi:hypothetical protein CCC_00597 [Paramagnetospirillum magnetotacticum MS-1]|uniref:Secreted protein n=1 Tax=Paramagnetospirillum magnetotacticum MS-1 TaxID=272627 RepID=A0A0C2UXJ4_PARME|nr:hypothetical protein [Paramagnetospirillum magnetotacticum]KIL97536.1 hypothetical protein CCC_00597 [Paramagnetospirillum magnetotacticum MS-1]
MTPSFKATLPLALGLALAVSLPHPSQASDASDVGREMKLPVPVVESTLSAVDSFFAAPAAPANRMVSGMVKELALKAIRHRMSNLEDSLPGKSSDSAFEDRNANYKAVVRTTRHETTEARECVDNKVVLTASEGVPVIKDGAFIFDTTHPRISTYGWDITFCRTPVASGGFSDWALAPSVR